MRKCKVLNFYHHIENRIFKKDGMVFSNAPLVEQELDKYLAEGYQVVSMSVTEHRIYFYLEREV